jgi:predicted Ser/Thr protein kinase
MGIGPKVISYTFESVKNENGPSDAMVDFLMYEFVEGEPIGELWPGLLPDKKKYIINELFRQLRILDVEKLDKTEMVNPYRHIIVDKIGHSKPSVTLIDFERCKKTEHPANITQFSSYLCSSNMKMGYEQKKAIELSRKYSKSYSQEDFNNLVEFFNEF